MRGGESLMGGRKGKAGTGKSGRRGGSGLRKTRRRRSEPPQLGPEGMTKGWGGEKEAKK